MNDAEKKIKSVKLPDVKLKKHEYAFFRWLSAQKSTASFGIFTTMIKIREIVMVILIVALTAVNLWNMGKPIDLGNVEKAFAAQIKEVQEKVAEVAESVAALRPDNLVITPLYNGVANRTGESGLFNDWSILMEYESKFAIFAVLPAGTPPYTWSLDNPAVMELNPTPQGFLIKGKVKRTGKTTLRVKDSSGLTGELKISTEAMPTAPQSVPSAAPKPPQEQIIQLQNQLNTLQAQSQTNNTQSAIQSLLQQINALQNQLNQLNQNQPGPKVAPLPPIQ